ncbi:MAG: FG-GAP-like repeat-containing protein [Candidatus Paceibacterota bacterium]
MLVFLFFAIPLENFASADVYTNEDGFVTNIPSRDISFLNSGTINLSTGAFEYKYDFSFPEGRGQYTPMLKLTYNNQQASDVDVFGYGWKSSIPFIETINKRGVDKLYIASSTFYSSLSGELFPTNDSTTFVSRIERGDFLSYIFLDNVWEVRDKSGNKYYFGLTDNSRQSNTGNENEVAKWMLEKVEDKDGNVTNYTYVKSNGSIYPESISYSDIFEVKFSLATSTTPFTSYDKNFKVTRKYNVSGIGVYVNDEKVRSYDLRFGEGINESRILLLGITEKGYGESGEVILPETIFEYGGVKLPDWSNSTEYENFPEPLNSKDTGVRFGDLNGDGLIDVVRYYHFFDRDQYPWENHLVRRVHINKGGGQWDYDVDWSWDDIKVPFSIREKDNTSNPTQYIDMGTRLIDVNGDGLDDIVVAYDGPSSYYEYPSWYPLEQYGVYINNGSGFVKDTNWTGLLSFTWWYYPDSKFANSARTFADVNGDGLPDIITSEFISLENGSVPENIRSSVALNNGQGWEDSELYFPVPLGNKSSRYGWKSFSDMGTRLIDVNGDGLIDAVRGYKDDRKEFNPEIDERIVYLNTGNGWATSSDWILPVDFYIKSTGSPNTGYNLVDINGDRLPDIVKSLYYSGQQFAETYINTGNGWKKESYSLPFFLTHSYSGHNYGKAFVDIDGDTIVDILDLEFNDLYEVHTSGGSVKLNDQIVPDQLSLISSSKSGNIEVSYSGYLEDGRVNYQEIGKPRFNPVVVTSKEMSSNFGDVQIEVYDYKKADFYYDADNIYERKFSGFGEVSKITSLNKEVNYYHQGNGVSTTSEERVDGEFLIGQVYRSEVNDFSDNIYALSHNNFSTTSLSGGNIFLKLESDLKLDYDGDSDKKASANSYTYNNTNGSLLTKTEWGEVNGNSDGTFSDTGTDKQVTTIEYATNASGMVLPSKQTLTDNSGTKVQESLFYYDNQPLGTVTLGNKTKEENWLGGSNYINKQWTYNSLGLVTAETDPNGNTTNYTYDAYNLYPTSVTNSLNQTTQYEYDYSSGQVATTTDANGNIFATTYDGFGRPLTVTLPDPQTGAPVVQTEYVYTDTVGSVSVQKKNYLNSSLVKNSYTFLDGFGRKIQERQEAEESNQYVVKDYVYGDNGLLAKESLRYFDTGSARSVPTTNNNLLSIFNYDPVGRVSSVETVVGTTETVYDQWKEIVTDTAGNDKKFQYDAFGRLVAVTENEGTNSYTTGYTWNNLGNLTKITDAEGNVRNISYDSLGRRTSLEDLHAPSDSTFGTWTFAYDNAGNLTSKTDPESQTTNYTYDALNRQLTENYTGQAGTEITYTYDTCTGGVGQLCTAVNSSATTNYTYTPNNLLASEAKTINSNTYTTSYQYDRQGNQTLITYPDNSEVKYIFNKGGQVDKVEQRESGGTFANIVSDIDYGPHGQMENIEYGNGSITTRTYDATELYRLKNILTTATSTYGTGNGGEELATIEAELDALTTDSIAPSTEEEMVVETVDEPIATSSDITTSLSDTATTTTSAGTGSVVTDEDMYVEELITTIGVSESIEIISTSTDENYTVSVHEPNTNRTFLPETKTSIILDVIDKINNSDKKSKYIEGDDSLFLIQNNKNKDKVILKKTHPEVRLHKWKGEIDLGVRYNKVKGQGENILGTDVVEWKDKDKKERIHAYPLPATEQMEDGGFEIEVILDEKPDTNVFEFEIDGYEDLDFFYQPVSLEGLFGEGEICTETKCIDEGGRVTLERAENIVGSYAVYHKTKKNHVKGEINYATGKVYHIYRPKIKDANGEEVWGELDYKEGMLSVTVPQNFLETATYPVVVDPTFGNTSVGAYTDYVGHNWMIGNVYTSPSDATTVTGINFFTRKYYSNDKFKGVVIDTNTCGIVSDGVGVSANIPTNFAWTESVFEIPVSINPNTNYALTIVSKGYPDIKLDFAYGVHEIFDHTNSFLAPNSPSCTDAGHALHSIYATYETGNIPPPPTNATPTAPTLLETEGQTNPTDITDNTPEFTAIYNDPDTGDTATHYQLQVSTSTAFTNNIWDSTKTALVSQVTAGNRTADITYGGLPLASSTTYHWRIKFWDDSDTEGEWSTETATFSLAAGTTTSTTTPTLPIFVENVQNLTYTYDTVGNITQIIDNSETDSAGTITYTYDDLYRLTSASTTGASTTPYSETYSYNSIGNILTKSDQGTYSYQGDTGTNYANPHAATAIGGTTHTYDQNGNLLTDGSTTNTWNYRNELTESTKAGITTSYTYDHTGQRVSKTTGTNTTLYPFSNYELKNGNITKHIYTNHTLVATIEADTPAPKTYYNHQDHLNSTTKVTDQTGYLNQLLNYQPYGGTRIDNKYDTINQTKRYTGHDYDEETSLSYMGARYQSGDTGRFTSQDPVSLALGSPGLMRDKMDSTVDIYLKNPQAQNTYSYTANNPLKYQDKNGEWLDIVVDVGFTAYSAYKLGEAILTGGDVRGEATNLALDAGGALVPGVVGVGSLRRVAQYSDEAVEAVGGTYKLIDSETGKVVRTGRTNNLERREYEHARNPETRDYDFEVNRRTDDYATQRGQEQKIYDQHPEAKYENGGLNKQQPISNQNPRKKEYEDAAN